jgi:hypothetical protein
LITNQLNLKIKIQTQCVNNQLRCSLPNFFSKLFKGAQLSQALLATLENADCGYSNRVAESSSEVEAQAE